MRPKQVKIGGKNRPVFFGIAALRKFEELSGVKLSQLDKALADPSMDIIVKFVYAGVYGGYKKKTMQLDFKLDDVENWLDDYGMDNLPKLMEVYTSCMPMATPNTAAQKKA